MAAVGLAALGIGNFRFTSDIHSFFAKDYEATREYESLKKEFNHFENSIVYVMDFGARSALVPENLQLIAELTRRVAQQPGVQRVQSLTSAPYIASSDSEVVTDELFSSYALTHPDVLAQRVEYAGKSELLGGRLLSADHRVTAIFSQYSAASVAELSALEAITDQSNALKSQLMLSHPGLGVYLIGDLLVERATFDAALDSVVTLYPIIMLLGAVILWLFFRSFFLITAGFSIILAATLFTAGCAGWMGIVFDQTSILSIILVFIIVLADMVHINASFQARLADGVTTTDALTASLSENLIPIFLTSLTTAIGFLCLNACISPPLVTLGNLTALGVMSALVFTLGILPASITFLGGGKAKSTSRISSVLMSAVGWSVDHPGRVIRFFLLTVVIVAPFIFFNTVQDDAIAYFSKDNPVRIGFEFSDQNLANHQQVNVGIKPLQENIFSPHFLSQMMGFADWLKQQPHVMNVSGYHDVLRQVNQVLSDSGDATPLQNLDQDSIAQYWMIYEFGLPVAGAAQDFVSLNKDAVRYNILLDAMSSEELLRFKLDCEAWILNNMEQVDLVISSEDILFSSLSHDVVSSMLYGSILSLLLISTVLLISFGSVRYGLLSLVPNVLPAVMVYGAWGLLNGKVNMSIAITFSISLGLIVDDTVHILSRYVASRRQGMDAREAIVGAIEHTGTALIVTSLVIASGLAVLTWSDYGVHSLIGWVTAPIIVVALLLDFILLPALLVWWDRPGRSLQASKNYAFQPQ